MSSDHVDMFLDTLWAKGSRQIYKGEVDRFLAFINGDFSKVRCLEYVSIVNNSGQKASTIQRRVSIVRSYLSFLYRKLDVIDCNVSDFIETRKPGGVTHTDGLTNEEVVRLISSTENEVDRAILVTLFGLGLRRSELCDLTWSDFNQENSTLLVCGKGEKFRTLPVPSSIKSALLQNFPRVLDAGDDSPLFYRFNKPKTKIKKILPYYIYNLFKKQCAKIGIKRKLSPHSARVTAISNSLENGSNLNQVMYMAGHSNPSTTINYDRRRQLIKNSAIWNVNYTNKKDDLK